MDFLIYFPIKDIIDLYLIMTKALVYSYHFMTQLSLRYRVEDWCTEEFKIY